jgi:GT2 family glycosyltransferase
MPDFVPISVGIPTWARGERVLGTIERLLACNPGPAEIIVHVDATDGVLERALATRFPAVRVLSSDHRVGPGGGRHRCIQASTQPVFVSFDDDSYPLDEDFFAEVVRLFALYPDTALLAAMITHPWEKPAPKNGVTELVVEFTGCGWAVRRQSYLACPGFVDRPLAYGVEELDLGLQFHAGGFGIRRTNSLRAFHDTTLSHHRNPQQAAAAIQNVALLAWLRYPWSMLGRAVLQMGNMIVDQLRRGRWRGLPAGVLGIPGVLWRFRHLRRPCPAKVVRAYLARRRLPTVISAALQEVRA